MLVMELVTRSPPKTEPRESADPGVRVTPGPGRGARGEGNDFDTSAAVLAENCAAE